MKAATKNLLMAAVGIIQHAQEINSATGTAAIKGEQVNYDDVCGRLCADLEDLEKTIEIIASQEEVDGNRCTVKCTQGSSTFTTQEMKNMIDGIFDRLAEMGVSDPLVTAYWQEWSEP